MSDGTAPAWVNDSSVEPLAAFLNQELAHPSAVMPAQCPVCAAPGSLHIHLHRFYDPMGGAWVWCSRCQRYDHDRRTIPAWWINNDAVDIDALASPPEALDDSADLVDAHWNQVVSDAEVDP